MQAKDGQFHEVKPAGIYDSLREASAPNAAETETPRGTAPPLAPAEEHPPEALQATREASYTAVIEALVIAALHALEAHVWDVKKRVAILQERVEEVAESPAVTAGYWGTPLDTTKPLWADPQPGSHAPHRAENSGT